MMKWFILRFGLGVAVVVIALVIAGPRDADAQVTDYVPFGANFDYLFTLQLTDIGDGQGERWQAFDPTYDGNFYGDPGTGLDGEALWAKVGYDTSRLVDAATPQLTGGVQLAWGLDAPSPLHYSTINYFNNNGIVGTDFTNVLGFDEAAADGEKSVEWSWRGS